MKTIEPNAKLRLAVDARCLNVTHVRGMGRYLREVVTRGSADRHIEWELFADIPGRPFHLAELPTVRKEIVTCRGYRFHAWDQWVLPRLAARRGADVLHCPSTSAPWWQPVPTVVTVHDTLSWAPEDPDCGPYTNHVLPAAYRKCAAIITISQSSHNDIVSRWPGLEPKIHVIPHGVDDLYMEAVPGKLTDQLRALGVVAPYLLYVGGELPRKRAEWAIMVLMHLADPSLALVFCGLNAAAQARVLAGARPDIRPKLVFLPYIADRDMVSLYQNAVTLLYPTLYEGFGFPALEAQAVGTPAIFSALGSLAELRGPGAMVLPPEDLNAWVETCRRLLVTRRENPRPLEDSRQWARGFSWDVSAARHVEVYRKAALSRHPRVSGKASVPSCRIVQNDSTH